MAHKQNLNTSVALVPLAASRSVVSDSDTRAVIRAGPERTIPKLAVIRIHPLSSNPEPDDDKR